MDTSQEAENETDAEVSRERQYGFIRPLQNGNLRVPHLVGRLSLPVMRRAVRDHQCLYCEHAGERSGLLVIVFQTVARRLGIPIDDFSRTIRMLRADVLVLGDPDATLLMSGLEAWGASRRETLSVLTKLIEGRDLTSVCTLGHSSGGTAAVIYAALMPAERALVFNPIVDVPSLMNTEGFTHKAKVWARIEDSQHPDEPCFTNLTQCIAGPGRTTRIPTPIHVHYSRRSWRDLAQMSYLKGIESVALQGWEHEDHDLTRYLAKKDVLTDLLIDGLKYDGQQIRMP